TRCLSDWSSDVCSSDLFAERVANGPRLGPVLLDGSLALSIDVAYFAGRNLRHGQGRLDRLPNRSPGPRLPRRRRRLETAGIAGEDRKSGVEGKGRVGGG